MGRGEGGCRVKGHRPRHCDEKAVLGSTVEDGSDVKKGRVSSKPGLSVTLVDNPLRARGLTVEREVERVE